MHVSVLGASGATGRYVVQQALERGWTVSAVVRNKDSLKDIQHDQLKVVYGDIFEPDSLTTALEGSEAVISCLGPRGVGYMMPWVKVTFYSQSVNSIVAAMRRCGLHRLVVMTGACTKACADEPLYITWLLRPVFRRVVDDVVAMEDYLEGDDCPDIHYTIVKPTNLTYGQKTEGDLKTVEGQYAGGHFISRADVARFMLDCVSQDEWSRKMVAIAPT